MLTRRFLTRWPLLVVLVLFVVACGESSNSTSSAGATSEGAEAAAPASDATAGGLVAPTTEGGQVAFNDLQGQPTLVWFWAPW